MLYFLRKLFCIQAYDDISPDNSQAEIAQDWERKNPKLDFID